MDCQNPAFIEERIPHRSPFLWVDKVLEINDDIFDEVKGEPDSLAGLILELEGKIPEKETSIEFRNFEFKILSADNRRIKRIKVTIGDDDQV